ncbi:MAG: hypothetical protein GF320_03040 [Armatimonadia bacterium]|nr:hypothetical protein [Armatimonadia bacterium]
MASMPRAMARRATRAALLALALALCIPALAGEQKVEYRVSVDLARAPLVDVEMSLEGFEDEPIYLNIPLGYAYSNVESDHLEHLVAVDENDDLIEPIYVEDRIYGWETAPDRVYYAIRMDHRLEVTNQAGSPRSLSLTFEHPYVDERRAFLIGSALFLIPDVWDADVRVEFQVPRGWEEIAPWPEDAGAYTPPSLNSLLSNYVGLGRWDVRTLEVGGFRAIVAFGDKPAIDTDLLLESFESILECADEILGPPPHEEYVFFFPDAADVKGVSGSAKADSMALAVEYGAPGADLPGVSRLFAHELVHLYGHGRQPMAQDLLFFAEGFTEHYAYVLCNRAGVLTDGALRRALSELWGRLQGLPTGLTLAQAQAAFFDEREATALCYLGGMFRAMAIDARLREASGGERTLDDLMRYFYGEALPPVTALPQEYPYAEWRTDLREWWPDAPEGAFDPGLDEPLPWTMDELLDAARRVRGEGDGERQPLYLHLRAPSSPITGPPEGRSHPTEPPDRGLHDL